MELSGPISPEMLQGLMSQMMQNPGSASGAYRPRFTSPDISASQGFTLANTLGSRFGEGAGTVGMVADFLLPRIFPSQGGGLDWTNIVNRIDLARGVADPIRAVRSREYAKVLSTIGAQDLGMTAVNALGLDPSGAFAGILASNAPLLDMLSNGLVSDVARIVDPNIMTTRGAAGLISAQRGRESMNRLDSTMVGHLKNTLQKRSRLDYRGRRLGDVEGGKASDFTMRDNSLTSGMNLDDFAEVMGMAVDLNALDYSAGISDSDLEKEARKSLDARFGGNTYTQDDIAKEKKALRVASATVQGGSNLTRILSTLGSTIGEGMSLGERGNLAAQLGMVPGSSNDAAAMQDVLRNLKALGEAAGMTSKQMLDAGTAITRQFGGNLLINTATAAFAQTERRITGQALNDAGVKGFQGILDETTSESAEQKLKAQQANLMRMVVAGYNHPEYGAGIQKALETGDGDYLYKLATTAGGRGLQRVGADLTPAMFQFGTNFINSKFGSVATQKTLTEAVKAEQLAHIQMGHKLRGVDGEVDPMEIVAAFSKADSDTASVALALGMEPTQDPAQRAQLRSTLDKMGIKTSNYDFQTSLNKNQGALRKYLVSYNGGRRDAQANPDILASAMKQKIASLLTGTVTVSGLGETFARLKSSNTDLFSPEGITSILESTHTMAPLDRQKTLNEMEHSTEAQRKTVGTAVTDFYDAMTEWSKATGDTTPERRKALSQRGIKAAMRMNAIGLNTQLDLPWEEIGGFLKKAVMNPVETLGLGSYFPSASGADKGRDREKGDKTTTETVKVRVVMEMPPGLKAVEQSSSSPNIILDIIDSVTKLVTKGK